MIRRCILEMLYDGRSKRKDVVYDSKASVWDVIWWPFGLDIHCIWFKGMYWRCYKRTHSTRMIMLYDSIASARDVISSSFNLSICCIWFSGFGHRCLYDVYSTRIAFHIWFSGFGHRCLYVDLFNLSCLLYMIQWLRS